jgi:hypothetical protein
VSDGYDDRNQCCLPAIGNELMKSPQLSGPAASRQPLHRPTRLLRGAFCGSRVFRVNTQELTDIHQALAAVHDTVGTLTFPRCDQDDVFELIDRVETELSASHPNVQIIGTFLNSIARSLRAQPEAREACLRIEDVIERTGLFSTWQAGI